MKNSSTDRSSAGYKKTQRKRIARQLAAYSVAAGAGALGASDALAVPIPVQLPGGGPVVVEFGSTEGFDLNNDGVYDYTLENYFGNAGNSVSIHGISHLNFIAQDESTYLATLFGAGELIDGSAGDGFGLIPHPGLNNFFDTRGFVGLIFDIPGGSPHFGYLDISMDTSSRTLTVHGGAYESETSVGITTVPEPTGLGLLAMGAAGLATWKRKREDATC